MKKLLIAALLFPGVVSFTSCSSEEVEPQPVGDGVSFRITLPSDMQTRADDNTMGNVTKVAVNNLQWTIFEQKNVSGELKWVAIGNGSKENPFPDGASTENIKLPLMKNRTYRVAFFANHTNGTVKDGVLTPGSTPDFVTFTNGAISVNYDNMASNDINQDAFVGASKEITMNAGAVDAGVELTRPFAQVNWGTDDLNEIAVKDYVNDISASVSVTQVCIRIWTY